MQNINGQITNKNNQIDLMWKQLMVRLLTEINTLTNMKTKSKSNITGQKKKNLKRKRLKMKTTLNF